MTPADCAHIAPWTVVCRCEDDDGRYLQEVCPWCNQLLSRRPVPKVAE